MCSSSPFFYGSLDGAHGFQDACRCQVQITSSMIRGTASLLVTAATRNACASWTGLCDHKGLEPLYPIYQHGLMYGTADARELAAKGREEVLKQQPHHKGEDDDKQNSSIIIVMILRTTTTTTRHG